MLRISTLLCLALFLACAFGLYQVKYNVHELRGEVKLLEAELAEEKEALYVMRAEWAYLNRSERLQRLVEAHLHSAPLQGMQLADVAALPYVDTEQNTEHNYADSRDARTPSSSSPLPSYLIPVTSNR